MHIDAFGHTDIGRYRDVNEDNYLCLDLSTRGLIGRRPFFLLGVADGIGGHSGGELASSLAIKNLQDHIVSRLRNPSPPRDFGGLLTEAFEKANTEIFGVSSGDPSLQGMGTTLVAAIVVGDRAAICNVGDSRIYLIRNKDLRQISDDHSWAAEQIRLNDLSECDIVNSPFKHMITRSLGFESTVKTDLFDVLLMEDDYLLLCTDGLYDFVGDRDILKTVKSKKKPEKICTRLIELANHRSGRDNITQVIARVEADGRGRAAAPSDTVKIYSME